MDTTTWFAVETRPRAESAALANINSLDGFEAYAPQETRIRRTPKGKLTVQHPLMPGIIFVSTKTRPIFDVLKCLAVRDIMRTPCTGAPHALRPKTVNGTTWHFVDELRARENAGEFDYTPRRKPLVKGGEVRVLTGFFKDQIGRLLSAPTEGRAEIMMGGMFAGRMSVDVRGLEGFDQAAA